MTDPVDDQATELSRTITPRAWLKSVGFNDWTSFEAHEFAALAGIATRLRQRLAASERGQSALM
jgi:hypothetical protein